MVLFCFYLHFKIKIKKKNSLVELISTRRNMQPVTRGHTRKRRCFMLSQAKNKKSWEPLLWSGFIFHCGSCCLSVLVCYWLSYIRQLQSVIWPLSATVWPFMAHSYSNSSQTFSSPDNNRCTDCVQWSPANPLWTQSTSVFWKLLKGPKQPS